jgi:hypothetical protein
MVTISIEEGLDKDYVARLQSICNDWDHARMMLKERKQEINGILAKHQGNYLSAKEEVLKLAELDGIKFEQQHQHGIGE